VIAECAGGVAEFIHRRDDRMNRGFVGLQPLGRLVAERGALDEIAVVEQQRIRRLSSGGGDQRGGLGESRPSHPDGLDSSRKGICRRWRSLVPINRNGIPGAMRPSLAYSLWLLRLKVQAHFLSESPRVSRETRR